MKFNWFFLLLIVASCSSDNTNTGNSTNENMSDTQNFKFFTKLNSSETGITFENKITENEEYNVVSNDAMLQGAGVAILDVNNDGLMDVYFGGNTEQDRLYLNKGNFKFEDISEKLNLQNDKDWTSGISIADVNNDGFDDIYVCKFLYDDATRRPNKLYINNGDLSFTESAAKYGLADFGHSVMANFFDMDNDGDLDVYVCNQPPSSRAAKQGLGENDFQYTDRLYRNDGDKFSEVTNAAGITNFAYSLSATASDLDNDGWTDLYVACDYVAADKIYINDKKGGFINVANSSLMHMGNFSMGSDVADINNDGHLDVYTVDMVAEDNYRQKTNMAGMNPQKFWSLVYKGYHYQYMFNALQINNGNARSFSEIAQMAGISNTDWSWSPLFMDIDNDMYKDLVITNGLYMDVRNKDFEKKRKKYMSSKNQQVTIEELMSLIDEMPSVKIQNYAYRNNGNLGFEKVSDEWGLTEKGWSQGMAYADLDNDGDLDIVMSNTNQEAWVYKNSSADKGINNYISVSPIGNSKNPHGIGSRIELITNGVKQLIDHTPYRGYMSTSQRVSHFGLGNNTTTDIKVIFPGGKVWEKKNVNANQTIRPNITEAVAPQGQAINQEPKLFTAINAANAVHVENSHDDFLKEILLPYKMSCLGPVMAKADVNKDGNDDFYLGGSLNSPGKLFISNGNNTFTEKPNKSFILHKSYEDAAAKFADIDNDGDIDLVVGSGGNEFYDKMEGYQDRIYLNDGTGDFSQGLVLEEVDVSTGTISIMNYDKDRDNDLFIGGRQIAGKYGMPSNSNIIEFDGGFKNVTETRSPVFKDFGMVTCSEIVDLDKDGTKELVIAGEWMPLSVYSYNGSQFEKKSIRGLEDTNGMWNSMKIEDIDGDGNLDIVAGNLGLNNKYTASKSEPFKLFVNDFDKNGTNDVYLGFNEDGKTFPVRGRQCSSEQMPFVSEKYETYDVFGKSTVEDVLEGREEGMVTKEAYTFAHTVFYGDCSGGFTSQELPKMSQVAPVYSTVIYDFDGDGKKDIFSAGNYFNREVETTRSDAGIGCLMLNQGNREWKVMHPTESGILAKGDVRAVELLKQKNGNPILAIANNNSPMQFYQLN